MDFYNKVKDYFSGNGNLPEDMEQGTVNTFNSVNIPYNRYLIPSNAINRQGTPKPGTFGVNSPERFGQVVQPFSVTGPQNTEAVKISNNRFLNGESNGYSHSYNYGNTSLQTERPKPTQNYYINLASESLHVKPDPIMSIFFSDYNINHLRNTVVVKVKQITADSGVAGDKEGVTIQTPNMDDFFYYMVNVYKNYKMYNGSICFVNLKNNSDLKSDISKLNTDVLQEYISKMISQINMYIYYYRDASQLPEQLSLPVYTSTRSNNKVLEYNVGFSSGNSIGMARYDQVGNIV